MRAALSPPITGTAPGPWAWRVSADGWFGEIERLLTGWEPDPSLGFDGAVRACLIDAARQRQEWLYHPVATAVTLGERRPDRDLRLALWAAGHQPDGADLGAVTIPRPAWAWAPDGGQQVEAGRYELVPLGRRVRTAQSVPAVPVALDVWIETVGLPLPPDTVAYGEWSWAHHQPLPFSEQAVLHHDIIGFLRATRALAELHPDCAAWLSAVTKVAVPLHGRPCNRFRSGSSAGIPGLIFTDIDGPLTQSLETLVHESAHLWFCLAESAGPLIDPAHTRRYESPLRPDLRPLRGIFLAFHALAFMAAFYRDWAEVAPGRENALAELDAVRPLRDDAMGMLAGARGALTDAGLRFFETTMASVVEHAE
ncbi:aKG-HExxH-type peptide beta-hydroxylase [Actinoplanes derwentensis]|uniref:HEXXH motif-containing protein n=1 Tax=Actinoplanes derwentensis TaxID=113562 RepID=A0A1H1RYY0_9ACTN|nr:HEXXH motif-containing putative peptide modification protein [Actinoplanes derwentensis]GID84556.1 hypothetical protein Ade03nite_34800 [Actinoplanes derwentensis]SDS40796.1 HEXXH motif-containing protein [Actinoplanes derwentensis]